jgi:predicted transcriptional regulator of viral defense system
MYPNAGPSPSSSRTRLAAVLRRAGEFIGAEDVIAALELDRQSALKTLARWRKQGWLQRVGPGLYAPIPLDALATEQVLQDPWILVPPLFGPDAYIGGWTAAEHWDLTEQLFRDIFVFTTKAIRARTHGVHGITFMLRHISPAAFYGTSAVWRGRSKIQVSDVHRTIIDMFADPSVGGGIRHVADCFASYTSRSDADPKKLIEHAEKLGNGAVFKRMGFVAEIRSWHASFIDACRKRLTQGNANLDPHLDCVRLVKAWRLWIPSTWAEERRRKGSSE